MSLRRVHAALVLCLSLPIVLGLEAYAKDKPLTAIVLYDGPNGPAWVQVTGLQINTKVDVLQCGDAATFTNDTYKKLLKAQLSTAAELERGADGVIRVTVGTKTDCVAPGNLKLEKKQTYTPKELAQMAAIQGKVIAKSANGADVPPPFMANTKIHFIDAQDNELADYMLAQRGNTVAAWQEYLKLNPTGRFKSQAQTAIAGLLMDTAEAQYADFKKSDDFALLKKVRTEAAEAQRVAVGFNRAQTLTLETNTLLQQMVLKAKNEIAAFDQAVTEKKPGYKHLQDGLAILEKVHAADDGYPNLESTRQTIQSRMAAVDAATVQAEADVAADPDKAYRAIAKYASLASELPRIDKIVEADFSLHKERGNAATSAAKWDEAVSEYKKALALRADAGTELNLKKAQEEGTRLADQAAAEQAVAEVQPLIQAKRFIEAYEKLDGLPDGQRQFVVTNLHELEKGYATDLLTQANQLTRLHLPIKGKADEDAVRQAYSYLQKASKFQTEDSETVSVKLELASDKIAEYYLAQGQKSIDKPRGTGVALGYLYLLEGQRFKPDSELLRNAITKYSPEYDTRGKTSIFVQFRDQTSRRDSLGFADQLSDTVASRLESAGLRGVKVLARNRDLTDPTAATGAQLANFLLVGDIIQHRVDKKNETQRLVSHYRAGTREVKSPDWVEARRAFDEAQKEFDRLNEANKLVLQRNKKKEIAASQLLIDEQAKKLNEAKRRLETIQETELQDIIQPYNYTKRLYNYTAVLDVAYRASEMFAEAPMQTDGVKLELPKSSAVLENVKAEDSDGVVEDGAAVDEIQLLAEAESKIQTDLMAKLTKWVGDLPAKVLKDARELKSTDKEAAAAKYIIYLNSTPEKETPERAEAMTFLRNEFNITSLKPGS